LAGKTVGVIAERRPGARRQTLFNRRRRVDERREHCIFPQPGRIFSASFRQQPIRV
jgi:ABC-type Zn2+ transport system substrate-binding protein/surface adhesin